MKHYLLSIALLLTVVSLLTGCINSRDNSEGRTTMDRTLDPDQYTAYKELIAMYPEDNQGLGKEKVFTTIEEQPMTYGLILTSESLHFRATSGEESKRRIQKAVRWLLDNQDLDHDGKPGWGLPQAWDAFNDGTVNPINHPYTITSAIVINGLLETLTLKDFWSDSERDEILSVIAKVAVRWSNEIWSEGYGGGYFWYSPNPADDIFAVNSPSLFTGNLARLLYEHPDAFTRKDRHLVQSRVDDMARTIIATAELRQGLPFWDYRPKHEQTQQNDVLHHIYTLLGIEMFRDYGERIKLSWTREQAIASWINSGEITSSCSGPRI